MNLITRIVLSILFSAYRIYAIGQVKPIDTLIGQLNNTRARLPVEKLYLQLDKPAYLKNDTIWFKAYLLNADYLTPSTRSGLLYIELDDSNNKSIKRIMVPLASGLSWGNIALDESMPEGNYTLRAYTNWMRNFGEDYIFKKSFYIASADNQTSLVTTEFKQSKREGKDNIRANILISGLNREPVRLKDMQLTVINGKHTLIKGNASTGVDGKLDVNFDVPGNTDVKNLFITAHDVTKQADGNSTALIIPVRLNRPENTDLQFMPEGGKMAAGIPVKIGFKAIAEDGKGLDVSGIVVDSKNQEVAVFKSLHKGMGAFELTPQGGEIYTAKLSLPDGGTKSYPLPVVNLSGTGLRITDYNTDTLKVHVTVTSNLFSSGAPAIYYLVAQSRGVGCFGAQLVLKNTVSTISVPKSLFPTGIARFTLLSADRLPLNERIYYINQNDNLEVNITADKNVYVPHDSIALKIKVTDKTGKPVKGAFSMAVTDGDQVKLDSTAGNIENNLLLTSDLKGNVEEPGYYFENNSPELKTELDNLLLTQGWIGYDWKQVTGPETKPVYTPEREFIVRGTVTNVFNKPLAKTEVILLSKKPSSVSDTVTNKDGIFTFKGLLPVDTAIFIIQAKNKRGKNFNVGVTVDEFKPPVFVENSETIAPWYVNSDSLLLRSLTNRLIKQQAELKLTGRHVLKEVVIKAKRIIPGSKNLNDEAGADEVLDEKDMEKAGKMTLLQMLQQKMLSDFSNVNHVYKIHFNTLFLVIDGVNADFFFVPDPDSPIPIRFQREEFLNTYLNNLTAEDIVGIEAMYNTSKSLKYDEKFYPDLLAQRGPLSFAYLEVTTRSGNGAFMHHTPGVYLYKPLAFSLPKQFYRPRYALKSDKVLLPDLRSTIHWEPNIITDSAGNATVSFYSADKPSGYTIILEGTDMDGRLGFLRKKIIVK